jgi:hypothetical protein
MQKLCRECGTRKPHVNFHNKGVTSTGNIKRDSVCKDCSSILNRRFKLLYGADGQKLCSKCAHYLSWDSFRRRKQDGKLYLHSSCKECNKITWNKWVDNNKEHYKKIKKQGQDLLHQEHKKYERRGITKEQYNAVLECQQGLCAICQGPPKEGQSLAMDHNHQTNEFRGLLCKECNRALGLFGDNIDTLTNAVIYLKERGSYG